MGTSLLYEECDLGEFSQLLLVNCNHRYLNHSYLKAINRRGDKGTRARPKARKTGRQSRQSTQTTEETKTTIETNRTDETDRTEENIADTH